MYKGRVRERSGIQPVTIMGPRDLRSARKLIEILFSRTLQTGEVKHMKKCENTPWPSLWSFVSANKKSTFSQICQHQQNIDSFKALLVFDGMQTNHVLPRRSVFSWIKHPHSVSHHLAPPLPYRCGITTTTRTRTRATASTRLFQCRAKSSSAPKLHHSKPPKSVLKGRGASEKKAAVEAKTASAGAPARDYKLLAVQGVVLVFVSVAMVNVIGNSVVSNAVHLCRAKGAFFKKSGASRLGYIGMLYPQWVVDCGGLEALGELLDLNMGEESAKSLSTMSKEHHQDEDHHHHQNTNHLERNVLNANEKEKEKVLQIQQRVLDTLLILLQDGEVKSKAREDTQLRLRGRLLALMKRHNTSINKDTGMGMGVDMDREMDREMDRDTNRKAKVENAEAILQSTAREVLKLLESTKPGE